jgi:L-asparagine oxygenase
MDLLRTLIANGFADLGDFLVGAPPHRAAVEIAGRLRYGVWRQPDLLSANPIGSKPLNTYGGNYGFGPLPLHTDLAHWHQPPRYLMLRCLVGDAAVKTQLVHRADALRGLPESTVARALFRPRRRLDGRMYLVRLRQGEIFRWDQLFLTPDNAEARAVREALTECDVERHAHIVSLDTPGRTLVVDNWNMMHGRSAVPCSGSNRRIERAYFAEV